MNPNLDIVLECQIELRRDALAVAYRVTNTGTVEIGLFNRIDSVGIDDNREFASDHVYVDLDGPTLRLAKQVLPIPDGLAMSERPVPNITRVAPLAAFAEQFVLPLPVKVRNPLRRAVLAGAQPGAEVVARSARRATEVEFVLGTFAVDSAMKWFTVSPAHPDIFRVWPPGPAVDRQQLSRCAVKPAAAIDVLDYEALLP